MKKIVLVVFLSIFLCGCEIGFGKDDISAISVDTSELAESYLVDSFCWDDVNLIVTKTNGEAISIAVTADMIEPADLNKLKTTGYHMIKVVYKKHEAYFNVNVVATRSYRLTYIVDEEVIASYTVAEGETPWRPVAPEREGYAFAGWFLSVTDNEPYDFSLPITADLTFYAKWDLATLAVPTGLKIKDKLLTWNPVAGAIGYIVSVAGTASDIVTATAYDLSLLEKGEYLLAVQAVADPECNYDSPFSNTILYENYLNEYLKRPENIVFSHHTLSWEAVPNAIGYKIYIHGVLEATTTEPRYEFEEPLVGQYQVLINSCGDGRDYLDSNPFIYEYILDVKAPDLTVEDGIFVWQPVPQAVGYIIEINGTAYETADLFYEDNISTTEPNRVRIKTDFGKGLFSDYTEIGDYTIYAAPVNVDYGYDGTYLNVSWEGTAPEYDVFLNGEFYYNTSLQNLRLQLDDISFGANEFIIKANGKTADQYDSRPSEAVVINKSQLPPPQPRIDGFKLVWEKIAGAAGYDIAFNNISYDITDNNIFDCKETDAGSHQITLRSIAPLPGERPEVFYYDSIDVVFTFVKLASPYLKLDSDLLFWNNIDDCSQYEIYIDGVLCDVVADNEYRLPIRDENMAIEVVAAGTANNIMASNCASLYGNTKNNYYIVFTENGDHARIFKVNSTDKSDIVALTFPDTYKGLPITYIEFAAAADCPNLTTVHLPAELAILSTDVFRNCPSLADISFPASLRVIGGRAFENCTALTVLTFPENSALNIIRQEAFRGCLGLVDITLPLGLKTIEEDAFNNCVSIREIEFPGLIQKIDHHAFFGCESLAVVSFYADTPPDIGFEVFPKPIYFYVPPADLVKYRMAIGSGNYVLAHGTEIVVEDGMTCAVYGGEATVLCYDGNAEEVTVPELINDTAVTLIAYRAFADNQTIKTVTVPASVVELQAGVFSNCQNLTTVNLAEGLEIMGLSVFENCTSIVSIDLPDSIIYMYGGTFSGCTSLTQINLPPNINRIQERTFEGCTSLSSVNIPDEVKSIGLYAFSGCISLKRVKFPYQLTEIGMYAFYNCSALEEIFKDNDYFLIQVGAHAFHYCAALSDITNIKFNRIGDYAFAECVSLKEFKTRTVSEIGAYAFDRCIGLEEINIRPNVIMIGTKAFIHCYDLTIYLSNSAPYLNYGENWFGSGQIIFYEDPIIG